MSIKKLSNGGYVVDLYLCLSTGARWGGASTLRGEQVSHGRVTFLKTKNGKRRTVPASEALEKEIKTCDRAAVQRRL